jgi:hypothetical protein
MLLFQDAAPDFMEAIVLETALTFIAAQCSDDLQHSRQRWDAALKGLFLSFRYW